MRGVSGIVALVAGCLALAAFPVQARPDVTATRQSEIRSSLEDLIHALDCGETDGVQRAAASLAHHAEKTDWKAAANAIDSEAGRLIRGGGELTGADGRRLTTICHKLLAEMDTGTVPAPKTDPELTRAQETLEKVLAAQEYRNTSTLNWWQRFAIRALELIGRLLDRLFSTHLAQKAANIAYYITLGILTLPLVVLAGWLLWRALQSRADNASALPTRAVTALESPDVYRRRAQEFLQRGELVEALKNFHLALLSGLEQRGLVVHDRTRTNWEYLAQFQQRSSLGALVSAFRSLNLMYDRTVFGGASCDAAYVQQFAAVADDLLRGAGGTESPHEGAS